MRRRLALAVVTAALLLPASSLAASSSGVVLSVNGSRHMLQLVDARHVVKAFRFHGHSSGVGFGSRVRIRYLGDRISHLVVRPGVAGVVSFLARVVRTDAHGMLVRLGDRQLMHLPSSAARSASRHHRRIVKGAVVLVTEVVSHRPGSHGSGSRKHRPVVSPAGSTSESGTPETMGTVVELDSAGLSLQTDQGATMQFSVAPATLSSLPLSICDTVTVDYHHSGGALAADSVQPNDDSPVGPCASYPDGGSSSIGQTASGTVSRMTLTTITVTTSTGGSMTFNVVLGLSVGFILGDQVTVTFGSSGGTLVANDVEYQSQDAIGTATHVEAGSITLVLADTGQIVTYTDDPANESFSGISVGDQVDVSYHRSSGKTVVDSVSDLTNPN
jgi:hypothetical protein